MLVVATITCRREPMFAMMADSIRAGAAAAGVPPPPWLVVDERLWYPPADEREEALRSASGGLSVVHLAPSPSPVRGPGREAQLPDQNNARNAALRAAAAAGASYILFLEDCSVISRHVVACALEAAERRSCLRVPVKYSHHVPVNVEKLTRGKAVLRPCSGTASGGCYGAPVEALLAIDGFDEAYRGEYFNDLEAMVRLSRAGWPWLTTDGICFVQVTKHHSRLEVTTDAAALRCSTNKRRYAELLAAKKRVLPEIGYRKGGE